MRFPTAGKLAPFAALLLTLTAAINTPKIQNGNATDVIPNSYIVVYNDNVTTPAINAHESSASSFSKRWDTQFRGICARYNMTTFKGYHVEASDAVIAYIAAAPEVAYIELNTKIYTSAMKTIPNAPWGLSRIAHRYSNDDTYIYNNAQRFFPVVYILDSGIYTRHTQFNGRASLGISFIKDEPDTDMTGHGTFMAGIIGGRTYGVCKVAKLVSVKITGKESGDSANMISGINWVANDAKTRSSKMSLANISAQTSNFETSINDAVKAAVLSGVTFVVSAGNSNVDADIISPASSPYAITVGAINRNFQRALFSNYGNSLDVFAPGVSIISAGIVDDKSTATQSGSSQAAAFVSGLAAYFHSLSNFATPADLKKHIKDLATPGVVQDPGPRSPNLLVYNGNNADIVV